MIPKRPKPTICDYGVALERHEHAPCVISTDAILTARQADDYRHEWCDD